MTSQTALLALALLLGACAKTPPQRITALAEERTCPAFPLPPADLLKSPERIDFLTPSVSPLL